jgi:hypothetical protein
MKKIVLETDILQEVDKKIESGKLIRLPGGFVKRNPVLKDSQTPCTHGT